MGDGAALSRRGIQLSSLGTNHKWGIIKGVSKGGNDVISWWNTEYGYVIRFGYDGTNPISFVHNMNGFIDKNTKWVSERFTPADDEGIRGVWNDERKEYIWTVRGRNTTKERYNPRQYYNQGDTVYADDNIEQVPKVYIALQNTAINNGGTITPAQLNDTNYWQEHETGRNEYTLSFSEYKNGFVCFNKCVPKFYARWKKGYQQSNPFAPSLLYNNNRGSYSSWFDGAVLSAPYIQLVINQEPFTKKSFDAVEINSKEKPNDNGNAMEFLTEQHYSYLVIDDFDSDELHDILYSSWIKNDATVSADNPLGLNDLDTSNLFGEYLLAKYIFKQGVYNKLMGLTVKITPNSRLNTT